MVHVEYDSTLVIVSVLLAIVTCYVGISTEQLFDRRNNKKISPFILLFSGLVFGLAIWSMHFVGMLTFYVPEQYTFDVKLTLLSYGVAATSSYFAVWLITQPTLPALRLILGAILMGMGISSMHYLGIAALKIEHYQIQYEFILVLISILAAILGSALSFYCIFKYKKLIRTRIGVRLAVTMALVLCILGMHYIGLYATSFHHHELMDVRIDRNHGSHILQLIMVLCMTSLIFVAGIVVALLEIHLLGTRKLGLELLQRSLVGSTIQDHLTQLPNHLYLVEYAKNILFEHQLEEHQIAFIYIDLDRFKSINDVFGHQVGDQLLIQTARRLHSHLDKKCTLFRIGGDEFLLIIEHANITQATQIAECVLQTAQETYFIEGNEINISASLGIAIYPEHGTTLQELLINADAAMLVAKDEGRNTYTVFNFSHQLEDIRNQSKLINDLYKAVEEEQFILFYQPKFNTHYEICGVEALIRWKHPTLGLLTPNMFIDNAEKTGQILAMGYWTLEQACKQIQQWEMNGQQFYPISINLSAIQFENKKLFNMLELLLEKYKIQPNHLVIEITETTAMHHPDLSIRNLKRLKDMGIRIAIDDFGTGYSSFLYLKDLPVDELKIDRGFVTDLTVGSKEEIILESIIHLAEKLGLTVTAEGVETVQQIEILHRLGCHQFQGFLLGMPVNPESLILNRDHQFS